MAMSGGLEVRLSEIIGEGRNRAVSFFSGENVVAVVLKDGTLVEIPVTPKGKSGYIKETREERLTVYPTLELIRVTNHQWTVLSQQKYEARKDAK